MRKQMYVSGPLTAGARKELYEEIGKVVESLGYYAYIPHYFTDPETTQHLEYSYIYSHDMEEIEKSCMVIAYVGGPSSGSGAELERACAKGIPIIELYGRKETASRLLLGMPLVKKVIRHDSEEELMEELRQAILEIAP